MVSTAGWGAHILRACWLQQLSDLSVQLHQPAQALTIAAAAGQPLNWARQHIVASLTSCRTAALRPRTQQPEPAQSHLIHMQPFVGCRW